MADYFIQKVALSAMRGRRRHQLNGAFVFEPRSGNGVLEFNEPIPDETETWTYPDSSELKTGPYLLSTISGSTRGNSIYTNADRAASRAFPTVGVNEETVYVKHFYRARGTGDGNGYYLDAFNLETGQFIDNDFVNILISGAVDTVRTEEANFSGIVDADIENQQAEAFASIEGYSFLHWQPLGSGSISLNRRLPIEINTGGISFAIYGRKEKPEPPKAIDWWWWFRTKGGLLPPQPADPFRKWVRELIISISLVEAAAEASEGIKKKTLQTAVEQVALTAASIKKEIKQKQQPQKTTTKAAAKKRR